MFVTRPAATPPSRRDLHLVRAERRTFTGPAEFLADPQNRARVGEYLADMVRPYALEVPADLCNGPPPKTLGHSYGEMAEALIDTTVRADEPVDLLVLAFSIHDLRPGRQTAAYLSHVTPGAPMAFAICDQGSAAAFSALRIAREYASMLARGGTTPRASGISQAEKWRALVIVVEQASLPYDCPVPLPSQHQAVAMLFSVKPSGDGAIPAVRVTDIRQHPGVPADAVADLAAKELADLAGEQPNTRLILSDSLAATWPAPNAALVRAMPPGQPLTGVWYGLADELSAMAERPNRLIVADYDPKLGYLCLTVFG